MENLIKKSRQVEVVAEDVGLNRVNGQVGWRLFGLVRVKAH
jgi:hypothetical protein